MLGCLLSVFTWSIYSVVHILLSNDREVPHATLSDVAWNVKHEESGWISFRRCLDKDGLVIYINLLMTDIMMTYIGVAAKGSNARNSGDIQCDLDRRVSGAQERGVKVALWLSLPRFNKLTNTTASNFSLSPFIAPA